MSNYRSSDTLPLELWEDLIEEGFGGFYFRVKKTHPDSENFGRGRRNKTVPMVADIVRSHREVIADSDTAHIYIVSPESLMDKYGCGISLVRQATVKARIKLGLSSKYRFNKMKGCFVHETDTEKYKKDKMRAGRKQRGISNKKNISDKVSIDPLVVPSHQVKFKK